MAKVKFGIIGCGKIAERNHVPGLLKNAKDAEIVAMFDIVPEKAKALAKKFDLKPKFHKSEAAILADPNVDAVIIATPNSCHYPQTMHALAAGKHVLVEKPMSYTPEQADEMIDLSLKQGLVLQVNQSYRFSALYQGLRKQIADGLIGEVQHFRCQRTMRNSPEVGWSPGAVWFIDPKFEGSLVGDIAVHMADMMQWLVGPIKQVHSITRKRTHKVEDNVYALFDFANGATGTMELSWTYPVGFGSEEIYGTKGVLRSIPGGFAFTPEGGTGPSKLFAGNNFAEVPNSQACFIKAIRTGAKDAWTAGRQAIALVTAVREGGTVAEAQIPRNRVAKKAAAPAKKAAPAKAKKPVPAKKAAPAKPAIKAKKAVVAKKAAVAKKTVVRKAGKR